MSTQALITSRDPRGLHATGIFEAAYNKAQLDDARAQRLNERGGELQAGITRLITELTMPNQFFKEEVRSYYKYPKGYKIKAISEQANILRQLFPGIGLADEKIAERPLPPNAKGWFAIPKWQMLAPTYGVAVEKVLAMIASKRKFSNYQDGRLGSEYLQQHDKTAKMFRKLSDEQKDFDIIVVPAQFGLRHKGLSVRRAREVFVANEFGLGAFAIGIMLLTHPEREIRWEQLHIDCAGDVYVANSDDCFLRSPSFHFLGGGLRFDVRKINDANYYFGAASAFLP